MLEDTNSLDGAHIYKQNAFDALWKLYNLIEPRHDNKATVRPAKTQISLGIRPVWSQSSLCA